MSSDVAELKQRIQELEPFRKIFAGIPLAIYIWKVPSQDPGSAILLFANKLAAEHARRGDLAMQIGRTLDELFPDSALGPEAAALVESARSDRVVAITEPREYRGRWYRSTFVPAGDGVTAAIYMDVDALVRTSVASQALASDLRRSNSELEQFAYVASHDLQEPLRMVSSYVTLIEEELRDKLTDDTRMYVGFAVDGARRMQKLINDLLQYSRVGRARKFDMILADDALDDALAILNGAVTDRGAELLREPLPRVWADRAMLGRVFLNLIGNALKFRKDGEPLIIRIGVEEQAQDVWRFYVSDTGRGLDMKFAERVFVIFQRLSIDKAGTGIGLAECRKVVEQHGGRIWVESAVGEGATFYFTLRSHPPEGAG